MLNIRINLDQYLNLAQEAYLVEDMALANSLAAQVLQQHAEHPRALHLLGAMALHERRPDLAAGFLQRALAQQPENAAIHCDLATALLGVAQVAAASRHYRLALALNPELSLARENQERLVATYGPADAGVTPPDPAYLAALHALATQAAAGRPALAIRLYDCSLEAHPDQPEILARLGALYLQTGESRSAMDVLRSAVRLGHRSAETYHLLAKALRKRTLFEDALEAARAASQLDPADMDIQWTITQLLAEIHSRNTAIAKLRKALEADPNSEEIKFQIAALTDEVDLSTFPISRVAALFENYAGNFESHLVERLRYRGHEQLFQAITALTPETSLDILDLGCGTGLCGVKFKPLAHFLKGVDIAAAMIEQARARGIYDELEVLELVAALSRQTARYDLILAADVFEYVGNLQSTFAAAATALRPGGLFAFSVERTDQPGFIFNRHTSSFAHSLGYIQDLARQFGLSQAYAREYPLRVEGRTPLLAWIVVLRK